MGEKFAAVVQSMHTIRSKYIYIILIIGVLILLFAGGSGTQKEPAEPPQEEAFSECRDLEKMLEKIKGVGAVHVMVTYYSGVENEFVYDTRRNANQKDANGVILGEESLDKKAVLSDGAPVVAKRLYPEVKGVVVVAQGAGSAEVKKRIRDAVMTAMDLAAHKVCVLEKN